MFTLVLALVAFIAGFWNHTFFIVSFCLWITCYLDKLLWDSFWQSKLKGMLEKYENEKMKSAEDFNDVVKTNAKLADLVYKAELLEITNKNELTRLRSDNSELLRKLGKSEALVEVKQKEIERLNE